MYVCKAVNLVGIIRLRVSAPVPELCELFFPPRQWCVTVAGVYMYVSAT